MAYSTFMEMKDYLGFIRPQRNVEAMERVGILPDLWVAAIEMDVNENEVILHREARVPRTVVLCYYYSKN